MKIGFNLLLWTTNLGLKDFHLLEKLKKAGYDGVEVPIFEGSPEHYHSISELLKNLDLECTGISVIPDEEHNPISSNKSNRNKAKDFLFTFFVITEPAPTTLFSLIVIGATNEEFEPTKTLFFIIVLFLFFPS